MSTEEQEAAIGRLARERSEAKKQFTLLLHELQGHAERLGNIGNILKGAVMQGAVMQSQMDQSVSRLLDEAISQGGLEAIRSRFVQFTNLRAKIDDLEIKARAVGLD